MTERQERPLLTFALFAYNQEKYIREAVGAALAQDYSPLQIIISDDSSSDRTFDIIRQMTDKYDGPHQILINRNSVNLGIGGHINTIMDLVRGGLIVVAAADDISRFDRVSRLFEAWDSAGRVPDSVCSDSQIIDADGGLGQLLRGQPYLGDTKKGVACYFSGVQGAANSWSKRIFDEFGHLLPGTVCEDRIITLRAHLMGGVAYVNEPLVYYRIHGENISLFFNTDPTKVLQKTIEVHRRNANIAQNYVRDMVTAASKLNCHDLKLEAAIELARSMQTQSERKARFLASGVRGKLSLIFKVIPESPMLAVKWIFMLLFPSIYLRNQRANFRVKSFE